MLQHPREGRRSGHGCQFIIWVGTGVREMVWVFFTQSIYLMNLYFKSFYAADPRKVLKEEGVRMVV